MSVPAHEPAPSANGGCGRLNGWKEIAAYLDRGVRTVQRWEKEFGLPVRRLGPGRGETVFAFRHEMDAWQTTPMAARARRAAAPGESPIETSVGPAPSPAPPPPSPTASPPTPPAVQPRRPNWTQVAFLSLVVALAGWATWTAFSRPVERAGLGGAGEPATWLVDVDALVVSDARGRELWRYRFPFTLDRFYYEGERTGVGVFGGVEDLDRDQRREVWFIAAPMAGSGSPAPTLHVFEGTGTHRWSYGFQGQITYGRSISKPPWAISHVFVTVDPEKRDARAMWVTSRDTILFPSVLQRVGVKDGKPLSTYWSNGYITTVDLADIGGRPVLLVGACNSERKGSSLAVLDARNPNGAAPAERPDYQCTSCPGPPPEVFLVFPKPARFGPLDAAGDVLKIEPTAPLLTVVVTHGTSQTGLRANGIYSLDEAFRPLHTDTADNYVAAYRAMLSERLVPPGAPARVDADREFLPLLRWDPAAKRFVRVPLASPSSRTGSQPPSD